MNKLMRPRLTAPLKFSQSWRQLQTADSEARRFMEGQTSGGSDWLEMHRTATIPLDPMM